MEKKVTPGRPRSSSRNRQEQISQVASKLFAELGYEKTTIRLVAEEAGVDPKLVMHYFGNKNKLFMATVKVPSEVSKGIKVLRLVPKSMWGKRIADVIWLAQKSGGINTLVGVIRASASEPEAAVMFREFYFNNLLLPIVSELDVDYKELRATMMSSLMSGFVFTKEIVKINELAKAKESERKALFASVVQSILTSKI